MGKSKKKKAKQEKQRRAQKRAEKSERRAQKLEDEYYAQLLLDDSSGNGESVASNGKDPTGPSMYEQLVAEKVWNDDEKKESADDEKKQSDPSGQQRQLEPARDRDIEDDIKEFCIQMEWPIHYANLWRVQDYPSLAHAMLHCEYLTTRRELGLSLPLMELTSSVLAEKRKLFQHMVEFGEQSIPVVAELRFNERYERIMDACREHFYSQFGFFQRTFERTLYSPDLASDSTDMYCYFSVTCKSEQLDSIVLFKDTGHNKIYVRLVNDVDLQCSIKPWDEIVKMDCPDHQYATAKLVLWRSNSDPNGQHVQFFNWKWQWIEQFRGLKEELLARARERMEKFAALKEARLAQTRESIRENFASTNARLIQLQQQFVDLRPNQADVAILAEQIRSVRSRIYDQAQLQVDNRYMHWRTAKFHKPSYVHWRLFGRPPPYEELLQIMEQTIQSKTEAMDWQKLARNSVLETRREAEAMARESELETKSSPILGQVITPTPKKGIPSAVPDESPVEMEVLSPPFSPLAGQHVAPPNNIFDNAPDDEHEQNENMVTIFSEYGQNFPWFMTREDESTFAGSVQTEQLMRSIPSQVQVPSTSRLMEEMLTQSRWGTSPEDEDNSSDTTTYSMFGGVDYGYVNEHGYQVGHTCAVDTLLTVFEVNREDRNLDPNRTNLLKDLLPNPRDNAIQMAFYSLDARKDARAREHLLPHLLHPVQVIQSKVDWFSEMTDVLPIFESLIGPTLTRTIQCQGCRYEKTVGLKLVQIVLAESSPDQFFASCDNYLLKTKSKVGCCNPAKRGECSGPTYYGRWTTQKVDGGLLLFNVHAKNFKRDNGTLKSDLLTFKKIPKYYRPLDAKGLIYQFRAATGGNNEHFVGYIQQEDSFFFYDGNPQDYGEKMTEYDSSTAEGVERHIREYPINTLLYECTTSVISDVDLQTIEIKKDFEGILEEDHVPPPNRFQIAATAPPVEEDQTAIPRTVAETLGDVAREMETGGNPLRKKESARCIKTKFPNKLPLVNGNADSLRTFETATFEEGKDGSSETPNGAPIDKNWRKLPVDLKLLHKAVEEEKKKCRKGQLPYTKVFKKWTMAAIIQYYDYRAYGTNKPKCLSEGAGLQAVLYYGLWKLFIHNLLHRFEMVEMKGETPPCKAVFHKVGPKKGQMVVPSTKETYIRAKSTLKRKIFFPNGVMHITHEVVVQVRGHVLWKFLPLYIRWKNGDVNQHTTKDDIRWLKRIMYGEGATDDHIKSLEVSHLDHEVLNHAETNLPIEPKKVNAGRQKKCSGYRKCNGCGFEKADPECHCVTRCHKRSIVNGICGKPKCQHSITLFKDRFNNGTKSSISDFRNFNKNKETVSENPTMVEDNLEEGMNLDETQSNVGDQLEEEMKLEETNTGMAVNELEEQITRLQARVEELERVTEDQRNMRLGIAQSLLPEVGAQNMAGEDENEEEQHFHYDNEDENEDENMDEDTDDDTDEEEDFRMIMSNPVKFGYTPPTQQE